MLCCFVWTLLYLSGQVDGLPIEEFLDLSSLAMTDPMSGAPLVPGGDEIDVTMAVSYTHLTLPTIYSV